MVFVSFSEIVSLSPAELFASYISAWPVYIFMIGSTEFSLLRNDDFICISLHAITKITVCRRKKKWGRSVSFYCFCSSRILQMMRTQIKNLKRKNFLTRYVFISYHRDRSDAYHEQGYGPQKLELQLDIVCSFLRYPHSLLGSWWVTRSRKSLASPP